MVLPRLLHPVNIEVRQLQRSESFVDDDFREPIQQANRTATFNVAGQVSWKVNDRHVPSNLGTEAHADGYVLFRYTDLRLAGMNDVKQGDQFVALGLDPNKIETDYYVVKTQPIGHYTDRKGPTMVRAYFKDRSPARNPPATGS